MMRLWSRPMLLCIRVFPRACGTAVWVRLSPLPFDLDPAAQRRLGDEDGGRAVADLAGASGRRGARVAVWLQTREGRHPLLEAEAERLGLTQAQQTPAMVAAPADQNDLPETDIAIERVTGERGLANAQAVSESGFGARRPAGWLRYIPRVLRRARILGLRGPSRRHSGRDVGRRAHRRDGRSVRRRNSSGLPPARP